MGKRSRDKGAAGERELARLLTELTGRPWRRSVGQARKGSDLPDVEREDGPTEVWIECKRGQRPSWEAAMRQADEATDGRPVVVATRKDRGEWVLHVRLRDVMALDRICYDVASKAVRDAMDAAMAEDAEPYTLADHLTLTPRLDEAGELEGDDA